MARKKKTASTTEFIPPTFITVSGLGKLNETGRVEISCGYKRQVAPPDQPLQVLGMFVIQEMMGVSAYSNADAPYQDLDKLIEKLQELRKNIVVRNQ